jgi:hypothetical protein
LKQLKVKISARCWWLTPLILATLKAKTGRIGVQGQSGQIVCKVPISKATRTKWIRGVTQAVEGLLYECLFCKHEALSSNPSLTKNTKQGKNIGLIKRILGCLYYIK